MGYTRISQIAEGKNIPALNEDEKVVKSLAAGGSGGGGSVLPPFKFYALVLTYDSTKEIGGEGRIYRCKDGQFERTHVVADFSVEIDSETSAPKIVPGQLTSEEGASDEDVSDAGQVWLAERVFSEMNNLDAENLDTLLPLMVFIS